jgi:diguanylate cyclase (GGDEF)-like protein
MYPRFLASGEQRVLRSVTEVEALLLFLAVLNFFIARAQIEYPALYLGVVVAYGALALTFRFSPWLASAPRHKLIGATTGMVVFITIALALSGGSHAAALGLYLLPVITAALTLGKAATVGQLALVLLGRVTLAVHIDGIDVFSLQYVLAMVTEAIPLLLAALLTTGLANEAQLAHQRLEVKRGEDDLTGLLNMQAFSRLLDEEQQIAESRGGHYALLLVDVDELKAVNDRFGPDAGNRALRAVALAIKRSSRSVDLIARYGGDEFLVLVAGASVPVAKVVANRIRHNVFTTTMQFAGALHRVSVSIGIAVFPEQGRELRDLVLAAASALERDKENRRPVVDDESTTKAKQAV